MADEPPQPEQPQEQAEQPAQPEQAAPQQQAPKQKAPSKWPERWLRFKAFVKESHRVLRVTKKPTPDEFKVIVKISGLGILVIGFMGFLIFFASYGIKALPV